MVISAEVRELCERAVLCWLATADASGRPNVSPKETFLVSHDSLVIAHIASPRSAANIGANPEVCVALIDIFEQRGFQLRGLAQLHLPGEPVFAHHLPALREIAPEPFPIKGVITVQVSQVHPITAPSSWLFPQEDPVARRAATLATYGVSESD